MTALITLGIGIAFVFVVFCAWEAQAIFPRIKILGMSLHDTEDQNKPFLVLCIKPDEPMDLTDLEVELIKLYRVIDGIQIEDTFDNSIKFFSSASHITDKKIGYASSGYVHIAKNKNGRLELLLDKPYVNEHMYTITPPRIEMTYKIVIEVRGKLSGKKFYPKRFHDYFMYWSKPTLTSEYGFFQLPNQENMSSEYKDRDAKAESEIIWLSESKRLKKKNRNLINGYQRAEKIKSFRINISIAYDSFINNVRKLLNKE